jgi:hypothetical protein
MGNDPEGAELLRLMRLDGFGVGQPKMYDGIAQMAARVRRCSKATRPCRRSSSRPMRNIISSCPRWSPTASRWGM